MPSEEAATESESPVKDLTNCPASKMGDKLDKRERTITECSTDSEFGLLDGVTPLTIDDLVFSSNYASEEVEEVNFDPTAGGRLFSAVQNIIGRKRRRSANMVVTPARRRWNRAVKMVLQRGDPWEKFHLDQIPTERALRHRYSAITGTWQVDECKVKIDRKSFAHGAMRECFRMKKLSNFSHSNDWGRDSNNYVAKRYMDPTDRDIHFQDVKLQMDAKLWAEEYNRHNPPKKVDIFSMGVLELMDRPQSPLFHIEHYIDGEYIKYNSNSGFVDDRHGPERMTPQALSHFTFERSGHQLVVVDIQGVGDLYTDPQIHTASAREYGDGNLGTQGMALFFHSHKCNAICQSLGLTPFDLSSNEIEVLTDTNSSIGSCSETRVKLDEVIFCETPSFKERADFSKFFRERTFSSTSVGYGSIQEEVSEALSNKEDRDSAYSSRQTSLNNEGGFSFIIEDCGDVEKGEKDEGSSASSQDSSLGWRKSNNGDDDAGDDNNEGRLCTQGGSRPLRVSRPSCVSAEMVERQASCQVEDNSVLGLIHLDLAKYHETCRFDADVQDIASALFHLRAAADCGNMQALVAIAQIYTGRPNDILPAITQLEASEHEPGNLEDVGLDFLETSARLGDSASMAYLAEAFDTGLNLGSDRDQSYSQALSWYLLAGRAGADRACCLLARAAEIYLMEEAGCLDARLGAETFEEAAEAAMEEMKGKLATRYYCRAEEAWAMVDE